MKALKKSLLIALVVLSFSCVREANPVKPRQKKYYRIKQVDKDGNVKYSTTILVR